MKFSLTIIFTLIVFVIKGQTPEAYLKENAVKINKADSLDNSLYKLFSDFQLIMLGEMHGTNEPAKLLIGFTELLCNNGDSVQVGLEIPANEIAANVSRVRHGYRRDSVNKSFMTNDILCRCQG